MYSVHIGPIMCSFIIDNCVLITGKISPVKYMIKFSIDKLRAINYYKFLAGCLDEVEEL